MSEESTTASFEDLRVLEAEARALRQRLQQREDLLKVLNRRLLQLERGENGGTGMERVETGRLMAENRDLQEQLDLLRNTKLFRWSKPARETYSRLRHPG